MCSVEMELLPLLCLCLLSVSGTTFADGNKRPVIMVKEGKDATLPCSFPEKRKEPFRWMKEGQELVYKYHETGSPDQDPQFLGRVSHFSSELKKGNASIIIRNTKLSDSGHYTCEFPYIRQTFSIQLLVERVVIMVKEGSEATLPCSIRGISGKQSFRWIKDGLKLYDYQTTSQVSQLHGRVIHFESEVKKGNASIIIKNTKLSDSGHYTCEFPYIRQTFNIQLLVERVVIMVKEGSEATLPCYIGGISRKQPFRWMKDGQESVYEWDDTNSLHQGPQFFGRVSHSDSELKKGNASIILKNTKLSDSGHYTCTFSQQTFNMQLLVGDISKVSIRALNQTKNMAVLQCEVEADFLKPRIEWEDSDGNILPAEEPHITRIKSHYSITVQVVVTKTNNYHCVAEQEEISHEMKAETYVFVLDELDEWRSPPSWREILIICAFGCLLIGLLCCKKCCRRGPQYHVNTENP
ncbi:butyrophilin subfamily 1 member A1-like isoform X2 [Anabas testudineus]|uniref:butyrophilin subfamily 1 member A1-like isoform X2 n=1 Tax=Anabas testudineus TaxID=64144 RepID=UPI000E45BADA|nr:butyrophilin subfamily 1 member A1-like isoform X2 [Anabas testudineus]